MITSSLALVPFFCPCSFLSLPFGFSNSRLLLLIVSFSFLLSPSLAFLSSPSSFILFFFWLFLSCFLLYFICLLPVSSSTSSKISSTPSPLLPSIYPWIWLLFSSLSFLCSLRRRSFFLLYFLSHLAVPFKLPFIFLSNILGVPRWKQRVKGGIGK